MPVHFDELPEHVRDQIRSSISRPKPAQAQAPEPRPRSGSPFRNSLYWPIPEYMEKHKAEFEAMRRRRSPKATMLTKVIGAVLLAYVLVAFAYACSQAN